MEGKVQMDPADKLNKQLELFESLSREAKIILCIILNAPSEVYETFLSRQTEKVLSLRKLKHTIHKAEIEENGQIIRLGWSYNLIRNCLNELREFTRNYISL